MKKIKPLEFACLIPFCIIGILIGINTQRTFNIAEEDAYISIILTIILGIIPIILFSYIHNYEKDLKINNKIEKLYGKYLGTFINILIIIIFIVVSIVLLYDISNFISSQYLYRTPISIIALLLIITTIYNVSKGIENMSRITIIIFFINIILLISGYGTLLTKIDTSNFFPILKNGIKNPLISSLYSASCSILPLYLLLIIPKNNIKNQNKTKLYVILFYIISTIISLIMIISTLGTLGIYLCKLYEYPTYIALKSVSILSILERTENILSMQWAMAYLIILSYIIYYISENITDHIKIKKEYITSIIGIIIFILSIISFKNNIIFNNFTSKYLPIITLPILIISIITSILIFIKKRI